MQKIRADRGMTGERARIITGRASEECFMQINISNVFSPPLLPLPSFSFPSRPLLNLTLNYRFDEGRMQISIHAGGLNGKVVAYELSRTAWSICR